MVSIFSGAVLANFLLGEPIMGAFKNSNQLIVATAVWYDKTLPSKTNSNAQITRSAGI